MKFIKKLISLIKGEQNLEKLVKKGLKIGMNFKQMGGVIIDPSHCWHIEIGDNVVLAPRVHILAHDASTGLFIGYTKIANVKIGNNVFIGASSTILPGVTIGDNVIVGAGSVVSKDIPSNSLAVGVPARVISTLEDYLNKEKLMMNEHNTFEKEYTLRNPEFGSSQKDEMIQACIHYKKAFVK